MLQVSSKREVDGVFIEEKVINGDFSIEGSNIEIHPNKFLKALDIVCEAVYKERGPTLINIQKEVYDLDIAIQLYLLSYKYNKKLNFLIIENETTGIFHEVKAGLNKIVIAKKQLCNNNSDLLKELLLLLYDTFNPVIKRIIDNTYSSVYEGKKVLIVDNHNFFHRTFHGMPDMRDSKNRPTAVIKGLTTLIKDVIEQKPDFVIFANEGTSVSNVRKNIYPAYKENRSETPDDLKFQINVCLELLSKMGFNVISEVGYEADDIIASYTKEYISKGASVVIMTTDKDLYQIKSLKGNIEIYNPIKKAYITEENCVEKFGVGFDKCLLVQALMGDASDNIPGIKGVGVKSASALINQYGSLENMFALVDGIKGKMGEKIKEGKGDAFVSLFLVSLNFDLAKAEELYKSQMPENPFNRILDDLASYEIRV